MGKKITGIELIAIERQRQLNEEGYSLDDDENNNDSEELAKAAACYAMPAKSRALFESELPFAWPWLKVHWKPTPRNRIKELVKAGALIAAEIDRLNNIEDMGSPFTVGEERLLQLIAEANEQFTKLERGRQMEEEEWVLGIHKLRAIISLRSVRRWI